MSKRSILYSILEKNPIIFAVLQVLLFLGICLISLYYIPNQSPIIWSVAAAVVIIRLHYLARKGKF